LNKEFNCELQLGGSDQWGNIVTGVDLIRKISGNESLGLTTPLLTTSSGVKMGKSVSGAIWLNEEQLSPYDYYQFWRNTEDNDVSKFARLYCEFSSQELIEFDHMVKDNINEAKKRLAYVATKLCHGEERANKAQETAIRVFEKGEVGEDLPVISINIERIKMGIACYNLFFESRLASSKGEARRLIRGNGARINDQQVQDENLIIDESFIDNGVIKLSSGKKKHVIIKICAQ
jgi:tyrosyl-tRNA synthetase